MKGLAPNDMPAFAFEELSMEQGSMVKGRGTPMLMDSEPMPCADRAMWHVELGARTEMLC